MAAKKGPVDPLKAKEAKQKKIAIGGAVLLLVVLVVQVPKLMKQMGHSTAPPPQPVATSVTPATPGSTTPTPGAAPGTPTGTGSLLSESAPTAAIGQFSSFGQFASDGQPASKDPFAGPSGPAEPKPTAPKTPTTPPKPPTPPSPPKQPTTTTQTYTDAVISVNGVKETVKVGDNFPSSQPFFHLVSVGAHSAKISIAGGSLANGAATVTLQEGKPLTLMNTTDGTRYTLVLQSRKSGAGGSSTTTGVTPAPAPPATTTATTTTTSTTTP